MGKRTLVMKSLLSISFSSGVCALVACEVAIKVDEMNEKVLYSEN